MSTHKKGNLILLGFSVRQKNVIVFKEQSASLPCYFKKKKTKHFKPFKNHSTMQSTMEERPFFKFQIRDNKHYRLFFIQT